MSKEYTTLPMQSLSVDEKHDPISGHASPTSRASTGSTNGLQSSGLLPGGANKGAIVDNKKKLHPAFIISLWIAMSSSVIGEQSFPVTSDL